ncbi:MAG: ribose-5-phosphate isomerase [Candidatus Wildermuthbacteria bacterium RIFCSPHIGHO2_01_FULL_49_22b]|uniref:Ribose-5-phosphate isomerase n=1 Tax=Candidatus Wildermuthbacteria bacterium RIFCSPHIGHO2_01_FULL_49_22b TaxID=1802448 RepID=A0A1G2QVI3_9BACT|nr:MAG: ribose-5-phosphate isomerase [Candidatus Wildermuthbacteria bacterium RIFCSPHIGHO2_01_FULL_49_22b]
MPFSRDNVHMIYLATDHAGFGLKEVVKRYLIEQGREVEDMGAFALNPDDDYPDFILPAAKRVAENPRENLGIFFGASGQGEAMAANKIKGIRAAVYYGGSLDLVKKSRSHNDANVLSLGARFLTAEEMIDAVEAWLLEDFEGGRHERRVEKIKRAE